jgi:hypothetical protein
MLNILKLEVMNIFETTAFILELRLLMEIIIVQNSTNLDNPYLCSTYAEWEDSRLWLIDLGWNKRYCIN